MSNYSVQDGKIVENGGSALGCLSIVEAVLIFAVSVFIAWKYMHPVFAILTGISASLLYVFLFFKLFHAVFLASVALWGGFGYWIGDRIFSGDKIWAITFAVIAGLLAAAEKAILRLWSKAAA